MVSGNRGKNQLNDFEEEAWDEVFSVIRTEIEEKSRLSDESIKIQETTTPHCKICGISHQSQKSITKCYHCGLSVCSSCAVNKLCLYCFTNLKKPAQIFLKLNYLFIFVLPLGSLFVLIFFISWYQSLIYSVILFFMLQLLQYLFLNYIHRHSNKFISVQWENTINSKIFQENRQDVRPLKFISKVLYEDYIEKRKKRLISLREWSNKEELMKQTPIPMHYLDEKNEVDDEIQKKIQKISEQFNVQSNQKISLNTNKKTISNIKKCPVCGKIMKFGNFCADCNIKFCPKCQIEANPHSKRCLCGYVFSNLFEDFASENTADKQFDSR